jgi:hypothetical protein
MPDFYIEYDALNRLLAVRVTGAFNDAAMRRCYDAVAEEVSRHDVRAAFLDLSAVSEFNLSADAVRGMSRLAPLLPDPLPKYIVANQDHMFGMARMFQITSRDRDALHIVRTSQEVYTSLGLKSPAFERLDTH